MIKILMQVAKVKIIQAQYFTQQILDRSTAAIALGCVKCLLKLTKQVGLNHFKTYLKDVMLKESIIPLPELQPVSALAGLVQGVCLEVEHAPYPLLQPLILLHHIGKQQTWNTYTTKG
jgi:hypothetical protein